MKRITFTLIIVAVVALGLIAQDTESYTALKVTGESVPVIDGTIDAVWENVEIVPLTKVPEVNGVVHENISVPNPDPSDFYAEIGMLWNEDGIFFLFTVVDDKIVIEDDYYLDNDIPADKWWYDDNINILFSKDLFFYSFTQWEFAWQPGIDQEEKLSSDDWANLAEIDISLVESAWYNDGNTWILETFIDWLAFDNGLAFVSAEDDIYLEARARDDDDIDSWESMYQWSTINYEVESTGEGMGTVTLSSTEVQPAAIGKDPERFGHISIYPNPSQGTTQLHLSLESPGDVAVSVCDPTGKQVTAFLFVNRNAGDHTLPLDLQSLRQGVYLIHVHSGQKRNVLKFMKE